MEEVVYAIFDKDDKLWRIFSTEEKAAEWVKQNRSSYYLFYYESYTLDEA